MEERKHRIVIEVSPLNFGRVKAFVNSLGGTVVESWDETQKEKDWHRFLELAVSIKATEDKTEKQKLIAEYLTLGQKWKFIVDKSGELIE